MMQNKNIIELQVEKVNFIQKLEDKINRLISNDIKIRTGFFNFKSLFFIDGIVITEATKHSPFIIKINSILIKKIWKSDGAAYSKMEFLWSFLENKKEIQDKAVEEKNKILALEYLNS